MALTFETKTPELQLQDVAKMTCLASLSVVGLPDEKHNNSASDKLTLLQSLVHLHRLVMSYFQEP